MKNLDERKRLEHKSTEVLKDNRSIASKTANDLDIPNSIVVSEQVLTEPIEMDKKPTKIPKKTDQSTAKSAPVDLSRQNTTAKAAETDANTPQRIQVSKELDQSTATTLSTDSQRGCSNK